MSICRRFDINENFFLRIANFFYPVTCFVCGGDLSFLSQTKICGKCKESFPVIKNLLCQKCGMPLYDGGEYCYICKKHPKEYAFDKMRSVYLYKDSLRSLILKFKYSGRSFLARDFGLPMHEAMKLHSFYNDAEFIMPVPLNIVRRIKRGYNQAELLANEISIKAGIPILRNVLSRKKIAKPWNLMWSTSFERFLCQYAKMTDWQENLNFSFFTKNILFIEQFLKFWFVHPVFFLHIKFCKAVKKRCIIGRNQWLLKVGIMISILQIQ